MMVRSKRDPLLLGTQMFLFMLMAGCFLAAILIGGLSTFSVIVGDRNVLQNTGYGSIAMLMLVPMLAAYGWIVLLLRNIVGTVADGIPFTISNASRLRQMGWLALLLWLASSALHHLSQPGGTFHLVRQMDGPGLLAVLVLFILARVFREGSNMREELEGTV